MMIVTAALTAIDLVLSRYDGQEKYIVTIPSNTGDVPSQSQSCTSSQLVYAATTILRMPALLPVKVSGGKTRTGEYFLL